MRTKIFPQILSFWIVISFLSSSLIPQSSAKAEYLLNLPSRRLVPLSAPYTPAIVTGITLYPKNSLKLDFIIDIGDDSLQGERLHKESKKLINYFMAALTVPEHEMWVNLSPYEKNRIIPDGLGNTLLGRDMLAQDYILKQLSASLMHPDNQLANAFWEKVYKKIHDTFDTAEIPTNIFNKIWIIPKEATIYIRDRSVFVANSHLEVLMEEDYLALEHHDKGIEGKDKDFALAKEIKKIFKDILLPEIEKEVNEGKNFAPLRQIYHSLILAAWYKNNLKKSLLGKVYVDQNKVKGIDIEDKNIKDKIYNQYINAFKDGVFKYVKEDYDPANQKIIPKKYFSGGKDFAQLSENAISVKNKLSSDSQLAKRILNPKVIVETQAELKSKDSAIISSMESPESFTSSPFAQSKIKIISGKKDIEKKDIAIALKGLENTIKSQLQGHHQLFLINKKIVNILLHSISIIQKNLLLEDMRINEALKKYFDLIEMTTYVLHSQAWLSPTYSWSVYRERGILQGQDYSSSYERQALDTSYLESSIMRNFFDGGEIGYIFRNEESLFNSFLNVLFNPRMPENMEPLEKIYYSKKIPITFKNNMDEFKYNSLGVEISSDNQKGEVLVEILKKGGYQTIFISEEDIKDDAYFFKEMLKHNQETGYEKIFNIVIYGKTPLNSSEYQNLKDQLSAEGISVYGIHPLNQTFNKQSQHSLALGDPAAMLVLYTPEGGRQTMRLKELTSTRQYGKHINMFTEWYLSLLLDTTNDSNIDRREIPSYYNAISQEDLMRQAESLLGEYDQLFEYMGDIDFSEETLLGKALLPALNERIKQHHDFLRTLSPKKTLNKETLNKSQEAVLAYRPLLKYYQYCKWYSTRANNTSMESYARLETKLEKFFNDLSTPVTTQKGAPLPHSSLLFSSGMSTIHTILEYIAKHKKTPLEQPRILVGNNIFYEIEVLNKILSKRLALSNIRERNTRQIIEAIKTGQYNALLIDPIANAIRRPPHSLLDGDPQHDDLPVPDIKTIIEELITVNYSKPFYLLIDVSLFAGQFQISNLFEGKTLPDNFFPIIHTSAQKLYQKGLELTTGGGLTLFSKNQNEHQKIMDSLRFIRDSIGTRPSLFNYTALHSLWNNPQDIIRRTEKIFHNTSKLAKDIETLLIEQFINPIYQGTEVIHPLLENHPDHHQWLRNNSLGLPFFMLRFQSRKENQFIPTLNQMLKKKGLAGIGSRNSYGFDQMTETPYYPFSKESALRISLAPYDDDQMARIKEAFLLAFTSREFTPNRRISPLDNALLTSSINNQKLSAWKDPGGIDLNANNLKLRGEGTFLDINFENIPNIPSMAVDEVRSLILNITPAINFHLMLEAPE